jgi:hypothetical protein
VPQGDPKLGLDLEVGGVDAAIQDLGRVQQATDAIADRQTRQFTQTVQQIRDEVEFREARAQAAQREAREIEQARQRQAAAFDQAVQSARAQTTAMQQSSRATQDVGRAQTQAATTAIAFIARVQSAASAVTALSGALGDRNGTTGLVANVAATTAQFAAMGSALGPGGALITGVLGFSYGIAQVTEATHGATDAQAEYRHEIGLSIDAIDEYIAAARRMEEAQRRTQLIDEGLGTLEEQEAAAALAGRRVGEIGARATEARRRLEAAEAGRAYVPGAGMGRTLDTREAAGARMQIPELRRQFDELTSQLEEARAESRRLGELAFQVAEEEAAISQDIAEIALEEEVSRGRERRGGGGSRGGDRALDQMRSVFADAFPTDDERERARYQRGFATADEIVGASGDASDTIADLSAGFDEQLDALHELDEKTREFAETQRELGDAAREASTAFSEGWTDSIDGVVGAWQEANVALRRASQQTISIGALVERSLVAAGNSIADTIGGTMKGAFEDALGAWLDGSVDFVKAAEEMAKGVIKALVIESIVQAVTETARAIADLASYRYDSAAAHFAAAAAWAAVGVVAGGIGAGIGAFGGGDKGSEEGKASGGRDLASRSTAEDRGPQTTIINVYPGQVLSTARDIQGAVYDAINMGARDGMRIDGRATRGA